MQVNQTPPVKVKTRRQAFIPSVEVGPGGVVVVTYYDFRNDNNSGELTDYWAVQCNPGEADCRKGASWGGELRLTPKSFDMLNAPVTANAFFLGDYMGLTRAGDEVVPTFGIADGQQQSSIYARRIIFGGKAPVVATR